MSKLYRRMAPFLSLVIIQPLAGDRTAVGSDPDITAWLGRVDLLSPELEKELELPELPLIPEDPIETSPDQMPADPTMPEEVPGEEEVVEGPGMLPGMSAGDGPGVVEGVVFDSDGNGVAGVIITLPENGGFQVRTESPLSF